MRREARATVTMPVPISMLTDFCDCASKQPERAVNEFATQSPTIVVNTGFIDEERTMSGLLPVARIARPSFVLRKTERKITTRATAESETNNTYVDYIFLIFIGVDDNSFVL